MDFKSKFIANFIDDDRWKYIWNGLGVTLKVTFFAVLLGIAIGVLVAIIRSTHEKNSKSMRMGFGKAVLAILNTICKVYLTVIRGTPVVVQLLILYTAVFTSMTNGTPVAIVGFGLNSGAYVAEIFRSGIL